MSRKIKYNEINIIDCEASCYDNNKFPDNEQQDIIEIGICTLNVKSLRIYNKSSVIVKPKRSTISKYCTDLTSLTQADVDAGASFEEALHFVREVYRVHKLPWATWGAWDRRMIESQCTAEELKNPFSSRHIDIKVLFPVVFGLNKDCGLSAALEQLKLEFEGRPHCGADDAWNTAIILKECLRGGPLP